MKTIRGIYLNLDESDYIFTTHGLTFYFSSKVYLEKFKSIHKSFIDNETQKIAIKYKVNINISLMLLISLYKKIEKRGFKVIDAINNKELTNNLVIGTNFIIY